MATAGPNAPSTVISTGVTGTAWSNPSNAATSNDSYATVSLGNGATSKFLKATGFGFSIAAGSTIDEVTVGVECKATQDENGHSHIKDSVCRLNIPDDEGLWAANSANLASTGYYPTSDTVLVHGGAVSLWQCSPALTVDTINNSKFGVWLSSVNDPDAANALTASVDSITISVTYTASGATYNESITLTVDAAKTCAPNLVINQSASLAVDAVQTVDPGTMFNPSAALDTNTGLTSGITNNIEAISTLPADAVQTHDVKAVINPSVELEGDTSLSPESTLATQEAAALNADGNVTPAIDAVYNPSVSVTGDAAISGAASQVMESGAELSAIVLTTAESVLVIEVNVSLTADGLIVIDAGLIIERSASLDADVIINSENAAILEAQMIYSADLAFSVLNSLEMSEAIILDGDSQVTPGVGLTAETVVTLTVDPAITTQALLDAVVNVQAWAAVSVDASTRMVMNEMLSIISEAVLATARYATIHPKKIFNAGSRTFSFNVNRRLAFKASERTYSLKAGSRRYAFKASSRTGRKTKLL